MVKEMKVKMAGLRSQMCRLRSRRDDQGVGQYNAV